MLSRTPWDSSGLHSIPEYAPCALPPLEHGSPPPASSPLLHLIRLIIIISVFPFIVNSFYDVESIKVAEEVLKSQNFTHLIILIITSIILIYFFDKFKIPAALLSGTLFASRFLQISEIATYQFSPNIVDYCLLILGASVGCRFANKTFSEIGRNALHSFVATFLLILLGLIAAFIAGLFIDKNFFTLLLSYCPGGIYEVAVIAIFFDLDPEFVSFHHIIRLLMILFIVPLMLKIGAKKT